MKWLCHLGLAIALLTCVTGRTTGGDLSYAPERRDPYESFRNACERLVALEARYDLLKGLSEVKPVTGRDEKNRLVAARFDFERNAAPPDKKYAARAKDESKPFVYLSVGFFSGLSMQPSPDMIAFEWKGQTYQMWVQIYGSNAELLETVRRTVNDALNEPAAPKE